jgi:hypothetical protein
MTDGFSGTESVSSLSQNKVEHVSHSDSYGFRVLTQLCGKGDVLFVLKTHSSWVYILYSRKEAIKIESIMITFMMSDVDLRFRNC